MKTKLSTTLLLCSLSLSSCDKIKKQINISPAPEIISEPILANPSGAADPRQQESGIELRLSDLNRDTGTLQQEVEALLKNKEENELLFEQMTTALETLNKKNAEFERTISTLQLRVESTNTGGFAR